MNRPTPDLSQEGSRRSSASCQFCSWEGLGVGSCSQRAVTNRGGFPQTGDRAGGQQSASSPEEHGEFPAQFLRPVAGELVSGGGAHVTHEVDKAHGGCRGALPCQVHRKG